MDRRHFPAQTLSSCCRFSTQQLQLCVCSGELFFKSCREMTLSQNETSLYTEKPRLVSRYMIELQSETTNRKTQTHFSIDSKSFRLKSDRHREERRFEDEQSRKLRLVHKMSLKTRSQKKKKQSLKIKKRHWGWTQSKDWICRHFSCDWRFFFTSHQFTRLVFQELIGTDFILLKLQLVTVFSLILKHYEVFFFWVSRPLRRRSWLFGRVGGSRLHETN